MRVGDLHVYLNPFVRRLQKQSFFPDTHQSHPSKPRKEIFELTVSVAWLHDFIWKQKLLEECVYTNDLSKSNQLAHSFSNLERLFACDEHVYWPIRDGFSDSSRG